MGEPVDFQVYAYHLFENDKLLSHPMPIGIVDSDFLIFQVMFQNETIDFLEASCWMKRNHSKTFHIENFLWMKILFVFKFNDASEDKSEKLGLLLCDV